MTYRFYALYDKVYRGDILVHAYHLAKANGGAAGVDSMRAAPRVVNSVPGPKILLSPKRYLAPSERGVLGHLWGRRPSLPLPDPRFPMGTEAVSHTTLLKIIDKALDGEKMQAIARGRHRPSNEPGRHRLRLDFAGVEFLTASALGHLVVLHKEAEAMGGRLTLYNVGAMVYEVFAATQLTGLLDCPTRGNFPCTS